MGHRQLTLLTVYSFADVLGVCELVVYRDEICYGSYLSLFFAVLRRKLLSRALGARHQQSRTRTHLALRILEIQLLSYDSEPAAEVMEEVQRRSGGGLRLSVFGLGGIHVKLGSYIVYHRG